MLTVQRDIKIEKREELSDKHRGFPIEVIGVVNLTQKRYGLNELTWEQTKMHYTK